MGPSSVELNYVGEITYLACAIYVLCFGGLLLVCHSILSGKRNGSRKHDGKELNNTTRRSTTTTATERTKTKSNTTDENKDEKKMGWLLSKLKRQNSESVDVTAVKKDSSSTKGRKNAEVDTTRPKGKHDADRQKTKEEIARNERNSHQQGIIKPVSVHHEKSPPANNNKDNTTKKEARLSSSMCSDYTKRKTSEEEKKMTRSCSSDVVVDSETRSRARSSENQPTKTISEGDIPVSTACQFSTEIFDSLGDYFDRHSSACEAGSSALNSASTIMGQQKDAVVTHVTHVGMKLNPQPTDEDLNCINNSKVDSNVSECKMPIVIKEECLAAVGDIKTELSPEVVGCVVASTSQQDPGCMAEKPKLDCQRTDLIADVVDSKKRSEAGGGSSTPDEQAVPLQTDNACRTTVSATKFADRLGNIILGSLGEDVLREIERVHQAKTNRLRFAKDLANTVLDGSRLAPFVASSNSTTGGYHFEDATFACAPIETDSASNAQHHHHHQHLGASHPQVQVYADLVAERLLNELRDIPTLETYSYTLVSEIRQLALTELSNHLKGDLPELKSNAMKPLLVPQRLDSVSDDDTTHDVCLRQNQKSTLERRPLSSYAEKLVGFLDDDDEDDLSDLSSDEEYSNDESDRPSSTDVRMEIPYSRGSPTKHHRGATENGHARVKPLTVVTDCSGREVFSESDSEYSGTFSSQGCMTPVTPLSPPIKAFTRSNSPRRSFSEAGMRAQSIDGTDGGSTSSAPCLKETLVIDFGCGVIRAGLAGQREPESIFPSVVGVPRRFSQHIGGDMKPSYFGHSAVGSAARLQLDHPLKTDDMTDWSNVFYLMEYTLEELDAVASERPLLITSIAECDSRQREKLAEIVFERLNSPGLYLGNQGSLTLLSMGLKSGICLNSGFSKTQCIPVYEGCAMEADIQSLDIGGDELTNHLGRLMMANGGQVFSSSSERLILESIKKSCAYVAVDPQTEVNKLNCESTKCIPYTLPDGQNIEIGTERFECAEILFNPNEVGLTQLSVPQLITSSIVRTDQEDRMEAVRNIVISGGTSQLNGFLPRLSAELNKSAFLKGQHRLLAPADPNLAPWTGGSIMASLSTFEDQCMIIDEYEECGAKFIHRYCF